MTNRQWPLTLNSQLESRVGRLLERPVSGTGLRLLESRPQQDPTRLTLLPTPAAVKCRRDACVFIGRSNSGQFNHFQTTRRALTRQLHAGLSKVTLRLWRDYYSMFYMLRMCCTLSVCDKLPHRPNLWAESASWEVVLDANLHVLASMIS